MAANKRDETQLEQDRALLAELMYKNPTWTHQRLTDEINKLRGLDLTRQQITYDIGVLKERALERTKEKMEGILADELTRLDVLEATLWEAFEISKDDVKRQIIDEIVSEADGDEELKRRVSSIRTVREFTPGDRKLLADILDVQKERRKIIGAYAPAKIGLEADVTVVKGFVGISPDDWDE
jgi:hypothetical protein